MVQGRCWPGLGRNSTATSLYLVFQVCLSPNGAPTPANFSGCTSLNGSALTAVGDLYSVPVNVSALEALGAASAAVTVVITVTGWGGSGGSVQTLATATTALRAGGGGAWAASVTTPPLSLEHGAAYFVTVEAVDAFGIATSVHLVAVAEGSGGSGGGQRLLHVASAVGGAGGLREPHHPSTRHHDDAVHARRLLRSTVVAQRAPPRTGGPRRRRAEARARELMAGGAIVAGARDFLAVVTTTLPGGAVAMTCTGVVVHSGGSCAPIPGAPAGTIHSLAITTATCVPPVGAAGAVTVTAAGIVYPTTRVYRNPNFVPATLDNNIAVLEFCSAPGAVTAAPYLLPPFGVPAVGVALGWSGPVAGAGTQRQAYMSLGGVGPLFIGTAAALPVAFSGGKFSPSDAGAPLFDGAAPPNLMGLLIDWTPGINVATYIAFPPYVTWLNTLVGLLDEFNPVAPWTFVVPAPPPGPAAVRAFEMDLSLLSATAPGGREEDTMWNVAGFAQFRMVGTLWITVSIAAAQAPGTVVAVQVTALLPGSVNPSVATYMMPPGAASFQELVPSLFNDDVAPGNQNAEVAWAVTSPYAFAIQIGRMGPLPPTINPEGGTVHLRVLVGPRAGVTGLMLAGAAPGGGPGVFASPQQVPFPTKPTLRR